MLGSSYGSTNGASIDPATGSPYGPRFPDITVSDIVGTQRLLIDELGITKLFAIVGPSYGGFQAFQWAVNYPDMMRGIAPVVTSPLVPRERSEGNVARLLATLSKDPNWNGGDYYDVGGVAQTMTEIRMATLKTYGIEDRLKKTLSDPDQIEAAIRDEAARWAKGFDANSLIILAKALRGFDVTAQLDRIKAKVLFVLSRTDKLFPPEIAPGVMQGLKAAGRRRGLFPARQRAWPLGVWTRCAQVGAEVEGVYGEFVATNSRQHIRQWPGLSRPCRVFVAARRSRRCDARVEARACTESEPRCERLKPPPSSRI